MLDKELYNLTQNLQGLIFQQAFNEYQANQEEAPPPPPPIMQLRRGYAESPAWFMVQAAEFDPEPLTVERLRKRAIWSAPGLVLALLELLASEGWLDRIDDEYHLTSEGHQSIADRQQRMSDIIDSLKLDDIDSLEAQLSAVIDASLECGDPPGNWSLKYSKRRAPSADSSSLVKIVHHLSDLNAFRDDAHMASWRAHQIDGYVWESFSLVHDGEAGDVEALFAQRAYRGYSRQDFRNALAQLTEMGWISTAEGQYKVTEKGQQVHAEAERLTDEYFYAPWHQVGAEELQDSLQALFDRLS